MCHALSLLKTLYISLLNEVDKNSCLELGIRPSKHLFSMAMSETIVLKDFFWRFSLMEIKDP